MYQLFLSPLTLIFEAVYSTAFELLRSSGAAIFPLSLVVNLLLLPFYNRADAIQEEEREREKKMAPFVEHIKKTFKGDERFMMLQTLYKENNYKPIYAVRSSIALVLEVPFFIAAYNFLSKLPDLQGAKFLCFNDLSKPDGLLVIGGVTLNAMPILMTLINVVSSEIYTKGLKFKDKIMLHGMALIFLVLLYDSPSGLVLYWTLNNVFSLLKNVVNGTKNKKRTAGILFGIGGVAVLLYGFCFFHGLPNYRLGVLAFGALMLIPLVIGFIPKRKAKALASATEEKKADHRLFLGAALFLTILLGGLIPSSIIKSSPLEFVLTSDVHSPNRYVFFTFLTAVGFFIVWCGLFYYLASNKAKRCFTGAMWVCAITGVANYMVFGQNSNSLTTDLRFDVALDLAKNKIFLDLLMIVALTALIIVVYKFRSQVIRFISPVLLIAVGAMTVYNCYDIHRQLIQFC